MLEGLHLSRRGERLHLDLRHRAARDRRLRRRAHRTACAFSAPTSRARQTRPPRPRPGPRPVGALDVRPVPASRPCLEPDPRLAFLLRDITGLKRRRRAGARGRARCRAPDGLSRAAQARPLPQGALALAHPRRPLPLPHAPARGGHRPARRVRPAPRHRRRRASSRTRSRCCRPRIRRGVVTDRRAGPPTSVTALPDGEGGDHDGGWGCSPSSTSVSCSTSTPPNSRTRRRSTARRASSSR